MSEKIVFGGWLKRARTEGQLTQEELAERVGYSVETIHKIEVGTRRPSRQLAVKLAEVLNLTADDSHAFLQAARPPVPSSALSTPPLPTNVTTLIGREQETAFLRELLGRREIRLLTLIGPPGIGKTRLALHVATQAAADFRDGVCFVPLDRVADAALVGRAIGLALNVADVRNTPTLETLQGALRSKELLLLLDNFEHVLDAAPLVSALLAACPGITALVTSRKALQVQGEQRFQVPTLPFPERGQPILVADLCRYPAVALFVERAQAVQPDFELTTSAGVAVAEICRSLDGLPLSIELAAARTNVLPPNVLLDRLTNRLRLLTSGSRDAPERQQTLRGTLDWSYNLLAPGEQVLFRRLGVFVGGWSLEAAESVADYDGTLPWEVLDGLAALIDQSLLRKETVGLGVRYVMLETLREYALERLQASGEAQQVQHQHACYFLALAEAIAPQLRGANQASSLIYFESEHSNFRAALRWAQREEPALGLRLAGTLWRFWHMRGYLHEGRGWLTALLASPAEGIESAVRATALHGAGVLAYNQSDYAVAQTLLAESLAIRRALGGPAEVAHILNDMGSISFEQGAYPQAQTYYEESLALRRAVGDQWDIAVTLNNLGAVWAEQGNYEAARPLLEESLTIRRALKDSRGVALLLNNLGNMAAEQGTYGTARPLLDESLTVFRELGDRRGVTYTLNNLGRVALRQGDVQASCTYCAECLHLLADLGDKRRSAECLETVAEAISIEGHEIVAVRLWSAAALLRSTIGVPVAPSERPYHEAFITAVRAVVGEETWAAAWTAGQAMSFDQALTEALALL
ncbi:MAG TPA: tetratricopeptide repeat protein [Chloroflexia bacterium]|nr:tetratricopeptide repeat protein [Chloroflexia bacterium]